MLSTSPHHGKTLGNAGVRASRSEAGRKLRQGKEIEGLELGRERGGVVVWAKEPSAEEHREAHSSLQSTDSPILDKLFHEAGGRQGKPDSSFDEARRTTVPRPFWV